MPVLVATVPTHSASTTTFAVDNSRGQPASNKIGNRMRNERRGGRPPGFDADAYKQRNVIKRCINYLRLKQWHGQPTRINKLAIAYQVALHPALWPKRHNLQ
ncbi:hypothetical protein [Streptomyces collinus]|uniref:hypothetical protein n=1 Tax=Streptomyces collinus TaxID=42684 RepID=UPI0036B40963